jgi:hypothetical protein
MAMRCKKCNGIIPDIMLNGQERNDCKHHIKPEINWPKFKKLTDSDFKHWTDSKSEPLTNWPARHSDHCLAKECADRICRERGLPLGSPVPVFVDCHCPRCCPRF